MLALLVSQLRASPFRLGALTLGTRQKAVLNSSDRLYEELRDQSFAAVGPRLGEKAKAIQVNYQVRRARRLAMLCTRGVSTAQAAPSVQGCAGSPRADHTSGPLTA